jgi:hypothetical protein
MIKLQKRSHIFKEMPQLNVDDSVRTYIKKTTFKTEYEPRFSREVYTVAFIKDGHVEFIAAMSSLK